MLTKRKFLLYFVLSVFYSVLLLLIAKSEMTYKDSIFSSVSFALFFCTFLWRYGGKRAE